MAYITCKKRTRWSKIVFGHAPYFGSATRVEVKMASGGRAGDRGTPVSEEPAVIERHSPLRNSPSPECEYKRELPRNVELAEARASPHLSRKTLDELGQENENTEDPDNLPLHSTWTFWFDR